jgi:TLC domain
MCYSIVRADLDAAQSDAYLYWLEVQALGLNYVTLCGSESTYIPQSSDGVEQILVLRTLTLVCDDCCLCRPNLWWLYKLYMGVFAAQLLMLVTWETRRKDFYPMLLHHIASLALIGLSMQLG